MKSVVALVFKLKALVMNLVLGLEAFKSSFILFLSYEFGFISRKCTPMN